MGLSGHPGLAWASATADGRAWLERLPQLLEECVEQWLLQVGEPFPYAYASLALPAQQRDGGEAVLKICFPHRESEHEADALARWSGDGAVRLLAQDRERWALLIERCRPGTPLRDLEADAALDVIVGLLPRLWVAAGEPFRPLAEEAAWWAAYLPDKWQHAGRPFEKALLDAAVGALTELAPTQGEQVLLHQDLHADNVLSAEREPWLVIDPKPLVGEREFGLAPLVRGSELGHCERAVRHRLDRLTADLGLDRERALGWTLGQTLAWAWENDQPMAPQVEIARWLYQAA
jgi:streptomycin 6-kinase